MLTFFKKSFVASVLTFICLNAYAVEKKYIIEVLVIEHKDKSDASHEAWPINPGSPNTKNATLLHAKDSGADNFSLVPKSDYDLDQAKQSLAQKTGSTAIYHTAWTQTLVTDQAAPARLIGGQSFAPKGDGSATPEIDGTITVTLSKYLHAKTDLVIKRPVEVISSDTALGKEKLKFISKKSWPSDPNAVLKSFRIQNNDKIKKEEVLYIDHPVYGILITIRDAS